MAVVLSWLIKSIIFNSKWLCGSPHQFIQYSILVRPWITLLFSRKWRIWLVWVKNCYFLFFSVLKCVCLSVCLCRHTQTIIYSDWFQLICSLCECRLDLQLEAESTWKTSQSGREGSTQRRLCLLSALPQMIQIWAAARWKQAGILLTQVVGWDQLEPDWGFFLRVTNFKLRKSAEASVSVDGLMHFLFTRTMHPPTHTPRHHTHTCIDKHKSFSLTVGHINGPKL